MSILNRLLFIIILLNLPSALESQASAGKFQQAAEQYFDAGDYRSALRMYRQAGLETSPNKNIRLRMGISMYQINDIDGAVRAFQSLINEGKTDARVYLYMAKSYQSKNLFAEAIAFYKRFLQRTNPDDPLRVWVKDELTRCANGLRIKYADQIAYVENAGPAINTQHDEFGVKNSPTTIDKIYFNSDRAPSGGTVHGKENTDIYSASLINGRWTTPESLPHHINSPGYDEVSGFSSDGQILYFLTFDQTEFKILTDTFSDLEGQSFQGIFKAPFRSVINSADLTFFNDSIVMFASDMPGGYGGYDLYISVLSNGRWSDPVNLGPSINTFYNERFPFLTRNGMELFYSSDNLQSVGGYDIFISTFDAETSTWALPQNAGFPVNSSLDDTHIALSPDGMAAYISSDRKEGHGGIDIYRVFFKQPIHAHQEISFVPTFYQTLISSGVENISHEIPSRPVDIKEYFISHLFIEENGEVLTPQNIKKLELLANLLLIYPQIKAELSCFEPASGQKTFNLYFSIKKAEKAAEYLIRKGIESYRLILKGYGSSFPLARNSMGTGNNNLYLKLNHRIEIGLHDEENEPVLAHLENIPIPANLLDQRGAKFAAMRHGMYYSVQIASISQILQNQSMESVEEVFIEVNNANGNYLYMVGMVGTFAEAEANLRQMIGLGFSDAFVVPYLDGVRINREEMADLAREYPDLLFYLAKSGKN